MPRAGQQAGIAGRQVDSLTQFTFGALQIALLRELKSFVGALLCGRGRLCKCWSTSYRQGKSHHSWCGRTHGSVIFLRGQCAPH